jgi:hypothetical protein
MGGAMTINSGSNGVQIAPPQPGLFARLLLFCGALAMLASWSVPYLDGSDGSGSDAPMMWPFYAASLLAAVAAIAPRRSAVLVLWSLRLVAVPVAIVMAYSAVSALSNGVYGAVAFGSLAYYLLRSTGGVNDDVRCIPRMIMLIALTAFLMMMLIALLITIGTGLKLYLAGTGAMIAGAFIWRVSAPAFDVLLADELEPSLG